ncbi:LPS export ABC transporter periplasmic protein LptC [Hymenobacter sp. BT559]|uniref:LPS export ABC transporter periplasmic protein LptC n=1 Tax=Hymenobacter sp. BT559 TaxID=2795729 RepID=UPI0018EB513F|nr:LPS export ABC transporter periplasmic protein LptC [Hymenobacter sp. BT559]MBJ6144036.1 LPS export ABC transporter periplasmic protein LptC [Hymenobacter sp. BT559]
MGFLGGWHLLSTGLLLAMLPLVGCSEKEVEIAPVTYKGPLAETTNVETLVSDSARLQLRLTAPLEQQFENGDVVYPKKVKVTFYDKPGKLVINTLEAKYAKVEKSSQLYTMRGDVRVANVPQQQTLTTQELFYDKLKHKIYTDTAMFVRVQTPTEVLTGYGLQANEDFSLYKIRRPVGTFTLDQAQAQGK